MDLNLQPRAYPSEANEWAQRHHWWLAWLVALLAVGMTVGVSVAATDNDWPGTDPKSISHSPINWALQPVIVAGPSGRMTVAWNERRTVEGPRSIYTTSSHDNGGTWSAPTVVTDTADTSVLPDATIVEDQVFVAWCDQASTYPFTTTIYEADLATQTVRRIPGPLSSTSTRPSLASGAGRLHSVFSGGTQNQPNILYATRPLTAPAWLAATVVHTHTGIGSWYPVLAVGPGGNKLHVVWEERASSSERAIRYMRGVVNDAGADWTPPITLSTGITLSLWPDIAVDSGGNLHVVWGEQETVQEQTYYIHYKRYDAVSDSWSTAVRIDPEPVQVNKLKPYDTMPSLSLLEKDNQVTLCVAWHGFRKDDSAEHAEEVLLSCSKDGGQSWAAPQNASRTRGAEAISGLPSITFDAKGRLHAVWQERVDENAVFDYQIYHAHALNRIFLPIVARSQG